MGNLASQLGQSGVLDVAGTALQSIGASGTANSQFSVYGYQSQVAANNATIQRQNAEAALASGQYAEMASRLRSGAVRGAARAASASSGLDVSVGTPTQIAQTNEITSGLDAAMVHYNAAREAFGLQSNAANLDQESGLLAKAARDTAGGGGLAVLKSLVSGASSVADRWLRFKQAGAGAKS